VIAVLFQLNSDVAAASPVISGLAPHIAAINNPGTKTAIEAGLDFTSLIEHVQTTELFQYGGSLTTPPCAEGVTFLVTKTPLSVDVDTYNAIKAVVKFNARYTQGTLGGENLINVGAVSGTDAQFNATLPGETPVEGAPVDGTAPVAEAPVESAPAAEVPVETAAPVAEPPSATQEGVQPGQITKGATVVISEIAGQPTSLLGVIVKGR
jgi:hypothetical protein